MSEKDSEFSRIERVAWAAGLFEGEGCISTTTGTSWVATLSSTDHEAVVLFAEIVGVGNVRGPYPSRRPGWKPKSTWSAGSRAGVEEFARLIGPWLLSRRRARLQEALDAYAAIDGRREAKREAERLSREAKWAARRAVDAERIPRLDGRSRIVKDMRAAGYSREEIALAIRRMTEVAS